MWRKQNVGQEDYLKCSTHSLGRGLSSNLFKLLRLTHPFVEC